MKSQPETTLLETLKRVEADTVVELEKVRKAIKELEQNPECELIMTTILKYDARMVPAWARNV